MNDQGCIVFLLVLAAVAVSSQHYSNHCHSSIDQPLDREDTNCTNDSTCPTWFTCNSHKHCQCGSRDDGAIVCDERKVMSAVLTCHCVTYDEGTGFSFVGSCIYTCDDYTPGKAINPEYHQLPKNPKMLINSSICTKFHRTGLLCGVCEPGYSPLVLSYNLSCVRCPDGHKNWWKFVLAGFLPLTFFYFFVIFFSINATSSRLHGVVWFSQIISAPTFLHAIL